MNLKSWMNILLSSSAQHHNYPLSLMNVDAKMKRTSDWITEYMANLMASVWTLSYSLQAIIYTHICLQKVELIQAQGMCNSSKVEGSKQKQNNREEISMGGGVSTYLPALLYTHRVPFDHRFHYWPNTIKCRSPAR